MDPLSITTAVVSLTAKCMQTAKLLYDLRGRYAKAHITLTAICSETTVISISLSRLQAILLDSSDILEASTNMHYDVRSAFETVLTGCMVVFSALDEETQTLINAAAAPERMGFLNRTKLVWNESGILDLLTQIRNQQAALNMLIALLQMESTTEIRRRIDNNTSMLADIAKGTKRIRSTYPSLRATRSIYEAEFDTQPRIAFDSVSSIGTTDFVFDNVLVNSAAYRRVLRAAQSAQRRERSDSSSSSPSAAEITDDAASAISERTTTQENKSSQYSPKANELLSKYEGLQARKRALLRRVRDSSKREVELVKLLRDKGGSEEALQEMRKDKEWIDVERLEIQGASEQLADRYRDLHRALVEIEPSSLDNPAEHPALITHLKILTDDSVSDLLERATDHMSDLRELNDFAEHYHEMQYKYSKVKRYYFAKVEEIELLQNRIAKLEPNQESGSETLQNE